MKLSLSLVLFTILSTSHASTGPYLLTCRSSEDIDLTLQLRSDLVLRDTTNGWQNYWGTVDYLVKGQKGTIEADIAWRKDSRPGYSAFNVALMEPEEALIRKAGVEGGAVGFGSIDSSQEIKGSFKANWVRFKNVEKLVELDIENTPLKCEVH